MALALAVYRWVDHRRAARAVAVAVFLMLARMWQRMQRRLYGVHRMTPAFKTLLPQVPAEAPEPAPCQVKAEVPVVSSVMFRCEAFRIGDYVTYPDDTRGQITGIDEDGDLIVTTDHGARLIGLSANARRFLLNTTY